MITMPLCHKCAAKIMLFHPSTERGSGGYYEMVGCKDAPKITGYKDAETMCPLLGRKGRGK